MDSGTDGIVALGTTGEASVLSAAERQTILDITVEEVGGKVPVVAGTSSVNPVVVIEQAAQVRKSQFGWAGVGLGRVGWGAI